MNISLGAPTAEESSSAVIRTNFQVRAAAGEPAAVVRVRNLQTTVQGPCDAWKRSRRPQPISISVSVALNEPFGSSSAADKVSSDTVHYGLLSKAIQATLDAPTYQVKDKKTGQETEIWRFESLRSLVDAIWADLTGLDTWGGRQLDGFNNIHDGHFLDISTIRCLEFTAHLPKASLLGSGVSLTRTSLFQHEHGKTTVSLLGVCLQIHDLRVPTLIGVNDNERTAKQVVVANIEIEKFVAGEDLYAEIEAQVVNAMSESSFETLEALAHVLAVKIAEYLHSHNVDTLDNTGWLIRVILEKPIAVPFADASCVELSVQSREVISAS